MVSGGAAEARARGEGRQFGGGGLSRPRPDRAPSAPFVLTEVDKENVSHVTKDTSGAGRSDGPPVLPPAPTSQARFEEPQPSTSTSEPFPPASTSSVEPRAGQAPAPGSGEMGTWVVAAWPFDLCRGRDRRAMEESSGRVRLRALSREGSVGANVLVPALRGAVFI